MKLATYRNNYEGYSLNSFFYPLVSSSGYYDARDKVDLIRRILEAGKRIYVKFTAGARKGSIGYLDLKPEDFATFEAVYKSRNNEYYPYGLVFNSVVIKFDDSEKTVKVDLTYGSETPALRAITVTMDVPDDKTVYIYTTKPKPEVEPVKLYDQFGLELKEGQTIITNYGKKNDYYTALAKITRITDAGTIYIKTIPTPKRPTSVEERHGVYAINCMVVDEEFINRIMMAQLSK